MNNTADKKIELALTGYNEDKLSLTKKLSELKGGEDSYVRSSVEKRLNQIDNQINRLISIIT